MKPLDAKRYYRYRGPINFVLILAIFFPCAWLFSKIPYGFGADLALIGLLYYFFFEILASFSLRIDCPNPKCGKCVLSNTPWECGYCSRQNKDSEEHPFLNTCVGCGSEPKAYKCHHCGELIFFGPDELKENYAYCLNLKSVLPSAIDAAAKRREATESLKHEIEVAKLKKDKKAVQTAVKNSKPKTAAQRLKDLEEEFALDRVNFMGAEDFTEKHMALFVAAHPGETEKIEREREFVERFVQKKMPN